MEQFLNQDRPWRREYSQQFKAEILALCAQPGASPGFADADSSCVPRAESVFSKLPATAGEQLDVFSGKLTRDRFSQMPHAARVQLCGPGTIFCHEFYLRRGPHSHSETA